MNSIELERLTITKMRKTLLNGSLEELKLYFVESELTRNEVYYDLNYNINEAFLIACYSNKVDLVQYLLTSEDLPIHANVHYRNDAAVFNALENGATSTTQFLLTSPELTDHIFIEQYLDELFTMFMEEIYIVDRNMTPGDANSYSVNDAIFVSMNYLIYEYHISPTEHIIELLKEHTKISYYEPAIKQLNSNAIYNNLKEQLNMTEKTGLPTTKIKI